MTEEKRDETLEPEIEEVTAEFADEAEAAADQAAKAAEVNVYADQLARLQADFVNYKNRTEKERLDRIAFANADLVTKLLPVLDNFDRALKDADTEDAFCQGMQLIYNDFFKILEKEGLAEIESDDQPFDHNFHQAVMTESVEGVEEGQVIETFQKGYTFKDKVIRPSMVKVSA